MSFCVNAKYIKFGICTDPDPLIPYVKAYWELEEVYGSSVVYDSSTNGYNGTVLGGTILGIPGQIGTAASFDGSGDLIDCGTTVGNVDLNDFSISFWVSLNSSVNTFNGICGNYGSEYPYFYITVGDLYQDKIVAHLVIDSSIEVTVNSDTSISVGSWVHCVVVFDRDGDMKMYIDSVLQVLQSDISVYSALNITNTNEFNLGNVGSSRGGYYGDLKLDSVILFNKALTTGEVIRMYIDGLGIY